MVAFELIRLKASSIVLSHDSLASPRGLSLSLRPSLCPLGEHFWHQHSVCLAGVADEQEITHLHCPLPTPAPQLLLACRAAFSITVFEKCPGGPIKSMDVMNWTQGNGNSVHPLGSLAIPWGVENPSVKIIALKEGRTTEPFLPLKCMKFK